MTGGFAGKRIANPIFKIILERATSGSADYNNNNSSLKRVSSTR